MPGAFARNTPACPQHPGLTQPEISRPLQRSLGALLVVGADPVATPRHRSDALKNTFVIVQDMFLTETAALADVVFPAASLYEKTGTVTNTFGDVQLVRKAADKAGVKPDFEILVRLAAAWARTSRRSCPSAKRASRPIWANPAAPSLAKPTATLSGSPRNGLEPKLSPFDPLALLDEIERLVPGYKLDRLNLFGGNDVHTEPGFVPVPHSSQSRRRSGDPGARCASSPREHWAATVNVRLQEIWKQHQAAEVADAAAEQTDRR